MKISKIEFNKKNKERASIFVDGEFFCALQVETILKCRIKAGDEIDEISFEKILNESETIVAFNKCINLISKNFKTEFQIKQYLIQKKFNSIVIDRVINKLKEYDYINDFKYAKMFLELKKKTSGKLKIKTELTKRGVDKKIIQQILSEFKNDNDVIKKLANKFMKGKIIDLKTKEKLYRHLLSKGFTYDEIKETINLEEEYESWD